MQLLGAEIKNFASFDSQFIPLLPGVNVLAGKNNSGKTAALVALECLASLPFTRSPKPVPESVKPYFRSTSEVQIDLLFRVEEGDPQFLVGAGSSEALFGGESVLRVQHTVPAAGSVTFVRGTLSTPPGKNFEVLVTQGESIIERQFDFATGQHRGNSAPAANRAAPNQLIYSAQGMYEETLRAFEVHSVRSHRVPRADMPLASEDQLREDAENLAVFLQTLQSNNRQRYDRIARFLIEAFPEFSDVNSRSRSNRTLITLSHRQHGMDIPLTHCGTGVEQLLVLAAFLVTAADNSLVLMDEPHSFLHPSAERSLMRFLAEFPKQRIVISTHSAVVINSVPPDRITHIGSGVSFGRRPGAAEILHDLGYQNSDLLFSDRLIFVEGPSDSTILPILLGKSGVFTDFEIDRCGFPSMDGSGKLSARKAERSILSYEQLLKELGHTTQPHLYLFDGDKEAECAGAVDRLTRSNTGLLIRFLPRLELENYLLEPLAIASAISGEAALADTRVNVSPDIIADSIDKLLSQTSDTKLFPYGMRDGHPKRRVKGSELLERLYQVFQLDYSKTSSGHLIACHVSKGSDDLKELAGFLKAGLERGS